MILFPNEREAARRIILEAVLSFTLVMGSFLGALGAFGVLGTP